MFDLAPMIDCVFLLLIYFVVGTSFARPEDRLSPSLRTQTESTVGPTADFQPQVLEIFSDGGTPAFRVGSDVYTQRPALLDALRRLHRPSGIFVRATDDVPVAAVAMGLQAARDAGFDQVTYVPPG
jgi:biopolymer transport protein ExbD